MTGRAVILYTARTGADSIESKVRELEPLGIHVIVSRDIGTFTDPTLFDANATSSPFHYHDYGIERYVSQQLEEHAARYKKSA